MTETTFAVSLESLKATLESMGAAFVDEMPTVFRYELDGDDVFFGQHGDKVKVAASEALLARISAALD